MKKISKAVALFMAAVMVFTGIPVTAFASEEPMVLSEREIDSEAIEDGAFYFTSASAELEENADGTYLLKIARKGESESDAAVKLTMLDVTAKYGKDYTVKVYKSSLFESGVENIADSLSIKEFMSSADGQEYNYSDAIIDGTITAENQLTEEEKAEETAKLQETIEENKEELNRILLSKGKASPSETVKKNQALSLSEAKELMTGIEDDKEAMNYSEENGLFGLSSLDGSDLGETDPYLTSGKEQVGEALSSAFVYVNFPAGVSERYIEICPIDNSTSEGDRQAEFSLESYEDSLICDSYADFTLMITDDEEYVPDTVEFSDIQYYPAEGYVTVTVERSGNCNEMAYVMLDTEDITATVGVNYSAVHSKVIFSYGMKTRTVKIPVRTTGLTEEGEFLLKLQENVGCVIGEKNEAVCTIHPEDESFELRESVPESTGEEDEQETEDDTDGEAVSAADQQLLGANIKNDSSVLLDTNYNLSKPSSAYAHRTGSSGYTGSSYKMVADSKWPWQSVWAGVNFWADNWHYDWNGFQVEWEKRCKREYVAEFNFNNGDTDKWQNIYRKARKNFGKDIDNYFVEAKKLSGIAFHVQKDGAWKDTLTIYRVSPIKRIFDITPVGAEAVKLIDENGVRKPNTEIPGCSSYGMTKMENTVNGVLTAVSGDTITVQLADLDPKVYIKGLRIVNLKTKESRLIQTFSEGTRNASVRLTNDLIGNNLNYIEFVKNQSVGGLKGKFGIQAEIATMPATVKVKNDTRYKITLWDGKNSIKTGTEQNGYTVYHYNVGDSIRCTLEMNAGYQDGWEWNQIDVKTIQPANKKPEAWKKEAGTNYTTRQILSTEVELSAEISSTKNRLVVMVPNSQQGLFDTASGIFKQDNNPTKDDIYTYYNIAEGSDVSGVTYELKAAVRDTSYVPVWQERGKAEKYSQQTYYYTANSRAENNFLILGAEKADTDPYTVKGHIYYEDTAIGASVSSKAWYPADGLVVMLDKAHYGISNGGEFETMRFPGVSGDYVKLKVNYSGGVLYKTVRLSGAEKRTVSVTSDSDSVKITVSTVNMENAVLRAVDQTRPHISTVHAYSPDNADSMNVMICQQGDTRMTRLTAYVDTVDPNTGKEYEQTYTYQGRKITETEKPVAVEFVVLDPTTKKEKSVYKAEQTENNDGKTFTYSCNFQTGSYNSYQAGDLVFARLITNRKSVVYEGTDDVKKEVLLDTQVCAPVNTGLSFVENLSSEPQKVNINFPTEGLVKLPVIGELSMITDALGLSFGISETPERGVRLMFGVGYNWKNSHFDGNGKETSDTGFEYGLKDFKKGFSDMKDMLSTMGEKNALGAQAIGIPAWSFKPYAGVYFEFALYNDPKGVVDRRFLFTGGGGYIGASATFRYTYYMLVYGVPVYVGGDVNLTMTAEFGIAPNEGTNYALNDPTQDFFDDLIKNSHFDFVFRAIATGNAYAGIGICGTVGVRGGFTLTLSFINNPTIKKKYSDMRATGFAVTGQLKFWFDAILLSVPVPAYTWDVAKFGYFEDLENKKKNDNAQDLFGTAEEEEMTVQLAGDLQVIQKPRQQEESSFVANEDAGEELLGTTYTRFSEKTVLENSFDQPDQKLITYTTADGSKKMLMVYLDDDKSRSANERTRLMYTVYDNESQSWTEPKAVDPLNQNAAFSPELEYMEKEDEIMISWISRKKAIPEQGNYSDYLSTTQVYTARFDINAKDDPISNVTCMTDDNYLNANPKMICDPETGDILLYFLKSEVPSGITTAEELLKASMPQQNKANIAYFLYDGSEKKWITDKYFSGELSDPAKEQLLVSALGGQRFIPSRIDNFTVGGKTYSINNPVVSDYDLNEAEFYTLSVADAAKPFESEASDAERESWKDPDRGEENYWNFMKQRQKGILTNLKDSAKTAGVYAYVVDPDNNMDTDGDREIFLQTYDFEKHTYSTPIRLTENTKAESDVQIVNTGDAAYLFWVEKEAAGSSVQDGKAEFKYLDLTDLTDDTEENADRIRTADIRLEDNATYPTFSSYQVFSDADGNLTLAWQETEKIKTDEQEENSGSSTEIFSNSIYLAGLYIEKNDGEDPQAEEGDYSWSDGILLEYRNSRESKIFDSMQFASFDSEKLLMVSNQYKMIDSQDSYEITESELTLTTYRTTGSVYLTSVTNDIDFQSEEETAVPITLEFKNGGIRTAKGFNYTVELLDLESEVVGTLNSRYDMPLAAGSVTRKSMYVPFNRTVTNEEIVSLQVNVQVTEDETTEPTGVVLPLFRNDPYFEFGYLDLEHDGEDFVLTGSLLMDPEEEVGLTGNENLIVYGSGDQAITQFSFRELFDEEGDAEDNSADPEDQQPGGEYEFKIDIPLSKLKLSYGFEDLTVVVEKEGKVRSEYGTVRGYYDNPVKLLLNGKDTDVLKLRTGQQLELNGSCSPAKYYTNADMLFAVEDETVADLRGNVLKALKAGQTILNMSTDPYGGAREITVIVSDNYYNDDSDSASVTITRSGPSSAKALSGSWKQDADGSWYFLETSGSKATGWGYTGTGANKEYFHFNAQFVMDSGWFMDTDGTWYYLHENHDGRFGAMDRGWHKDASDGRWYYLDLTDGKMKTGWINVGGYWYYLSTSANEPAWVQDEKKRWVYKGKNKRSYGSMYENERTPDGYTVDSLGRWVK